MSVPAAEGRAHALEPEPDVARTPEPPVTEQRIRVVMKGMDVDFGDDGKEYIVYTIGELAAHRTV
ncbi:hypothetical protein OAN61_00870 [bacterium]|nr:hypothetical protein [bacterium]